MQLHLINGFLGSGKTTAIIAAAKNLLEGGKTVGIVTNDKGQFQVDAAFFRSSRIPTRQVTGGCFRCSFDEFEEKITQLRQDASPDVLFAESVGSCVDLVNTIFSPILQRHHLGVEKVTYSMFADIRLFRYWLDGEPLPFSESINYLFEQQIEEGRLLVLNKADLLTPEKGRTILAAAQARFPEKTILLQNALDSASVRPWLTALENENAFDTRTGFTVNYRKYKNGEQEMAWFDQNFTFEGAAPQRIQPALTEMIRLLLAVLQRENVFVGHLKFLISDAAGSRKISFTTADFLENALASDWAARIPECNGQSLTVMMNARLAMQAQDFAAIVEDTVNQVALEPHIRIRVEAGSAYNPEMSMKRANLIELSTNL